jgi:phosphohistidine phosphatase
MRLYLVQHGDAVTKEIDPDRPLSAQGKQDVERLANRISNWGLAVTQIIHSGKTRARQTAESLTAAFGSVGKPRVEPNLAPMDSPDPLLKRLKKQSDNMAVIGHMPYLGKLVAWLITGNENSAVVSPRPGTLVVLERDEHGRWSVICMLRPEHLK